MTQRRWPGLLGCVAIAVAIAAGSLACSKNKTTNPTGGTPRELNSGDISGSGGTYVHTFSTAGTFDYHCERHPSIMRGTVMVNVGAPGADASIVIGSTTAFPARTITVGTKIIWTNNAGMPHTVTSD